MKKQIISVLLAIIVSSYSYAQLDSATKKTISDIQTSVTTVSKEVGGLRTKLDEVEKEENKQQNAGSSSGNGPHALTTPQKILVVMPLLVFLLIFFYLIAWLKKDKFKLSDAIQGDIPVEIEKENPKITNALAAGTAVPVNEPATVSVTQLDDKNNPVHPKSASRFIALFSGMAAIILAVCLLSYYVYFAISGYPKPDFDKLLDGVLALGIGVVPYAVNKFTQPAKP